MGWICNIFLLFHKIYFRQVLTDSGLPLVISCISCFCHIFLNFYAILSVRLAAFAAILTKERKIAMNKRINRALTAGGITFSLAVSLMQTLDATAASARISRKKVTLSAGKTHRLKIRGYSGKISWKSSNKKTATVNKKGLVRAKKAGTATITARARSKKWTCKITVKKRPGTSRPNTTSAPARPTEKPAIPTGNPDAPTKKPVTTAKPAIPTKRPSLTVKPNTTFVPETPTKNPASTNVTEQSAYATLNSLRSTYPEGMPLTNSYYYYSPRFGNGYGCYGFAAKLSDTVFGTEQPYQTHSSFESIRVGDNIRIGNSHSVIVLTKESNFITVVEGNYNSSVHWNRKITSASLASSGFRVYTRY